MHDPFQGTGCLLPRQNGYSHPRPERRKQFAALPKKAPEALVRDTIYLNDPAEVWPHRALESRRIFQNLLRRLVGTRWGPSILRITSNLATKSGIIDK